jgi:hypothetical protein
VACLRSKQRYEIIDSDNGGQKKVTKLGLQPDQRDGLEFEFDLVGDLDADHYLRVTKTRYDALDGQVIHKPGPEFADDLLAWLEFGRNPPPWTGRPRSAAARPARTSTRCGSGPAALESPDGSERRSRPEAPRSRRPDRTPPPSLKRATMPAPLTPSARSSLRPQRLSPAPATCRVRRADVNTSIVDLATRVAVLKALQDALPSTTPPAPTSTTPSAPCIRAWA